MATLEAGRHSCQKLLTGAVTLKMDSVEKYFSKEFKYLPKNPPRLRWLI